jgi:hypothetical protein
MGDDVLAKLRRLEQQHVRLLSDFDRLRRETRGQPLFLNVVIFPVNRTTQDCSSFTPESLHTALGLRPSEQLWVERQTQGFIRIRLCAFSLKRRLLKWEARASLRNQHQLIIIEDLLPEERADKQRQRPVMQALFDAGFRPTWDRCNVAWIVDGKKFVFVPGEMPSNATASDIVDAAKRKSPLGISSLQTSRLGAFKRPASKSPVASPVHRVGKAFDDDTLHSPRSDSHTSSCSTESRVDVGLQCDDTAVVMSECERAASPSVENAKSHALVAAPTVETCAQVTHTRVSAYSYGYSAYGYPCGFGRFGSR